MTKRTGAVRREEAARLSLPDLAGEDPAEVAAALDLAAKALQPEPRRRGTRLAGAETIRTAWRKAMLWSVPDVCVMLRLHQVTVYHLLRDGAFPGAYHVTVRLRRHWRIPWAAVDAYQLACVERTRRKLLEQRARRAAKLEAARGSTTPAGPRGGVSP